MGAGALVVNRVYAARSDPSSSLYQAWFGVYTVAGDSAFRLASGKSYAIASVRRIADHDQRAWLAAMGDPHPFAQSDTNVDLQRVTIDGVERTLCLFHMQTHSDLNSGRFAGVIGTARRTTITAYISTNSSTT